MKLKGILRLFAYLIFLVAASPHKTEKVIYSITSKKQFDSFAGPPLSAKYGDVSSVKVLVDVKGKSPIFLNSKFYKYHHQFAGEIYRGNFDLFEFNQLNYSDDPEREFYLANINFLESDKVFYMDISVFDKISIPKLIELYEVLAKSGFWGRKLRLLLNSERLLDAKSALAAKIPIVTPGEIYKRSNYQAVIEGKTIGRVVVAPNYKPGNIKLTPNDILITNKTPEYLPPVKAVLLTEMQTPLSHLVILARNRKMPFAVHEKLFRDSSIYRFQHQVIQLEITQDTFFIKKWTGKIPVQANSTIVLSKPNLLVDSMVLGKQLSPKMKSIVGNKAANFGMLVDLSSSASFRVPEGAFAIPMAWYFRHIKACGADSLLRRLKSDSTLAHDLKVIRKRIQEQPIDSVLLAKVRKQLKCSGFRSYRFRSSTNAEDAFGFSGAGLYESHTGIPGDSVKTVERAIKKVWASLWLEQAVNERLLRGISHASVGMGILVHRSFPEEAVNGVVISKNIYRDMFLGVTVNCQKGDVPVVDPPHGVVCDQVVVYENHSFAGIGDAIEVVANSSINGGKPVMTEEELRHLEDQVSKIRYYYWKNFYLGKIMKPYEQFHIDVEFKLNGPNRTLYIKQVRVYNG